MPKKRKRKSNRNPAVAQCSLKPSNDKNQTEKQGENNKNEDYKMLVHCEHSRAIPELIRTLHVTPMYDEGSKKYKDKITIKYEGSNLPVKANLKQPSEIGGTLEGAINGQYEFDALYPSSEGMFNFKSIIELFKLLGDLVVKSNKPTYYYSDDKGNRLNIVAYNSDLFSFKIDIGEIVNSSLENQGKDKVFGNPKKSKEQDTIRKESYKDKDGNDKTKYYYKDSGKELTKSEYDAGVYKFNDKPTKKEQGKEESISSTLKKEGSEVYKSLISEGTRGKIAKIDYLQHVKFEKTGMPFNSEEITKSLKLAIGMIVLSFSGINILLMLLKVVKSVPTWGIYIDYEVTLFKSLDVGYNLGYKESKKDELVYLAQRFDINGDLLDAFIKIGFGASFAPAIVAGIFIKASGVIKSSLIFENYEDGKKTESIIDGELVGEIGAEIDVAYVFSATAKGAVGLKLIASNGLVPEQMGTNFSSQIDFSFTGLVVSYNAGFGKGGKIGAKAGESKLIEPKIIGSYDYPFGNGTPPGPMAELTVEQIERKLNVELKDKLLKYYSNNKLSLEKDTEKKKKKQEKENDVESLKSRKASLNKKINENNEKINESHKDKLMYEFERKYKKIEDMDEKIAELNKENSDYNREISDIDKRINELKKEISREEFTENKDLELKDVCTKIAVEIYKKTQEKSFYTINENIGLLATEIKKYIEKEGVFIARKRILKFYKAPIHRIEIEKLLNYVSDTCTGNSRVFIKRPLTKEEIEANVK